MTTTPSWATCRFWPRRPASSSEFRHSSGSRSPNGTLISPAAGRFHVDAEGHVGEYDVEQGPGYRVLELKDGGAFSSQVVRPEMREGHGQLSDLLSGPRLERRAVPSL